MEKSYKMQQKPFLKADYLTGPSPSSPFPAHVVAVPYAFQNKSRIDIQEKDKKCVLFILFIFLVHLAPADDPAPGLLRT